MKSSAKYLVRMVTATLCGPIYDDEYKDLELPFRSIALRMQFGATYISDTKISFRSLILARMWLHAITTQFDEDWDTYTIDEGTFFRHGNACIDLEEC